MEALKALFAGDLSDFKSVPFWSWNNFLDEEELVKQIDDMKANGMGGFVLHARTGLKEEYLGEKWFSCVSVSLRRARETGMRVWIYDENGWPSGFAGGKLLKTERFRARYLEYRTGAFDCAAFASFVPTDAGYTRVSAETGAKVYHNIYLRVSPANTDILNPEVTEAFIAETHEKYFARFRESFGRELVGFFTDEPQYYRWGTPYTHCVEEEFLKSGEDVRDGLIWLFVHDERGYAFRTKYYALLNKFYCENFYKKLYDWCAAHGCLLTGHTVEEGALFAQMYGGAAAMPSYEYEHVPAIDWLGRDCGSLLAPKQIGSAAAQLKKKVVLTETYGCAGYDVNPRELKSIAEFQYFNGVTTTCQHLYPYSMANRGKTDHPPVFSPQGNWGGGFKIFNDYFTRLGCLVGNTQEEYDVAIIHPVRAIWLEYIRSEDYESVRETEEKFSALLETLKRYGVTYQLIDERLLEKYGSIEGGALVVGERRYDKLIVPDMRTLARPTYAFLKQFGGKLLVTGSLCYLDGERADIALTSNTTLEELIAGRKYKFYCADGNSFLAARKGAAGEFLFLKNLSRTQESAISLPVEGYAAIDLLSLQTQPVGKEIKLKPCGSLILRKTAESFKDRREKSRDITARFHTVGITQNYLVLDYAQLDRGEGFGTRRALSGLFEDLLREDYKGEISVRQTFVLREKMPLTLVLERARFKSVRVNGSGISLSAGEFDVNFVEAEIGALVREGENELFYTLDFYEHDGVRFALFDPEATESLKNCLYYDTSIETAYLKGDFVVGDDLSLSKRTALPQMSGVQKQGYPFFKGRLTLEGSVDYAGEGSVKLALSGRYHVAEVYANGETCAFVLDDEQDITHLLRCGENKLKIVVRSSLRNLFGPHHFRPEAEPMGVGPYHFEFRGAWESGKEPADYTEKYNSVAFGINKITLTEALS